MAIFSDLDVECQAVPGGISKVVIGTDVLP